MTIRLFVTSALAGVAGAICILAPRAASAQLPVEPPPPPPAVPAPPKPAAPAPAAAPAVPSAAPAVAPAAPSAAPAAPAQEPGADRDLWIHHFAIGWYGVSDIPLANGTPGGMSASPMIGSVDFTQTVSAPTLGIRYWLGPRFGVDAAIGLYATGGSTGGSSGSSSMSTAHQGKFGMLLHGGLPIAIANFRHVSVELIPEINFGFATSSATAAVQGPTAPPNASLSGVRFDLGARAGGEFFFGFMGLPSLSLEASIGAYFTYQSRSISVGNQSASSNDYLFTTASFNSPWDFFKSTIAARYYF